jgi:signal transduction histidine kinase
MSFTLGHSGFRERLRAYVIPEESHRRARVLATARAFLAFASLTAIYLDPTEPARYAPLAYGLMVFYALYSLAIVTFLRVWRNPVRFPSFFVHGADLLWAGCIILFTEGPNSPFYLFFLFVLIAAAYRWGFRETLLTAIASAWVLFAEAYILRHATGPFAELASGQLELNRLIMRVTSLVLVGVLLGYLADQDKLLRGEASFVTRLLARLQGHKGLRPALADMLGEFARLYAARSAFLVTRETATGRLFLWEWRPSTAPAPSLLHFEELDPASSGSLLTLPAASWRVARQEIVGQHGAAAWPPLPMLRGARSLFAVEVPFSADWLGSLFLVDLPRQPDESETEFLRSAVRQVAPAIHSLYLIRRLRARAGALERARVARDLHDGVLQALLALELQADVLRQQAEPHSPALAADLAAVERQLHQQVIEVRELMQQMKPIELDPRQFLDSVADLTDRFARDTGIATTFVTDLDEISMTPRTSRELARIVQEALVNVRKHSGARNVLVRVAARNGHWEVEVDDDGCGFDFTGRRNSRSWARPARARW